MSVFTSSDDDNSDSEEEKQFMSDLDGGLEGGAATGAARHYTGSIGTTHDVTPADACCTMRMIMSAECYDFVPGLLNICLLMFYPSTRSYILQAQKWLGDVADNFSLRCASQLRCGGAGTTAGRNFTHFRRLIVHVCSFARITCQTHKYRRPLFGHDFELI